MAANNSGFNLDGLDEFLRNLANMGQQVDSATIDKALEKGSEYLIEKVKANPNVPVSDGAGPHGRDNFTFYKTKDGTYKVGSTGDFFYMYFYEVGTKAGTYKDKNGVTRTYRAISATPFFFPTFETYKPQIQEEMAKVIRRELGLS